MPLKPLVIDLDGTLIHTDVLHESALRALHDHPLDTLCIPLWLARGKAVLKRHLATLSDFDPKSLPYNIELLAWLRQQKTGGRKLVLCTASDESFAVSIADHLKLFDDVIASDGTTNLAGGNKARALVDRFGQSGFDYAGNSPADLAVWEQARHAIVVGASENLTRRARGVCQVEQVFPPTSPGLAVWSQVLRVHQWLKNLLLLIPLFASHQLNQREAWVSLLFAFLALSLCASSVYIANDLLDLESDRLHPRKRNRPFASGQIPAWIGVALAPVLVLAGLALGSRVGGHFLAWLEVYFALTCAYSWGLKRIMLVDCLTLAMLYTLRVVAGAAATGTALSFWLLAFSVFLFLSLAFVKRYAELNVQQLEGRKRAHGRAYLTSDAPLVQTLGITSGYTAALVLALYLESDAVVRLYRTPEIVWGAVPVLLFWVSWMWMQANRGNMHDDPLIHAVKDKASLLAGAAFAALMALGALGWPW